MFKIGDKVRVARINGQPGKFTFHMYIGCSGTIIHISNDPYFPVGVLIDRLDNNGRYFSADELKLNRCESKKLKSNV